LTRRNERVQGQLFHDHSTVNEFSDKNLQFFPDGTFLDRLGVQRIGVQLQRDQVHHDPSTVQKRKGKGKARTSRMRMGMGMKMGMGIGIGIQENFDKRDKKKH
jgi:hypothetical protein